METIFSDLVNGNLVDARLRAGRRSFEKLFRWALEEMGWSSAKALAAASYLKGTGTFQAYCDAEESP
jgi:hypothetical protein